MANFFYTKAKHLLLGGNLDFDEAGNDIRVLLVMTNTSADTEKDVDTISAFATLDEYDGANYVRKALANQTTVEDEANDRGEFDADDVTWTALGAGTRQCQAAIIYKHVTNDTDSVPLAFIDTVASGPTFPWSGNGGNIVFTWNAEGIIQAT